LRTQIAEVVAGSDDQTEHVAVYLGDPVAGDVVGRDDKDRLNIAG
jgi:hypothetical protein